jgi:uncharacterized membrane protein (UPF0136 family)
MATFDLVLWSYVLALLTVGLVGFMRAGSKVLLFSNCLLALPLVVAALEGFGMTESQPIARAVTGCSFAFFAWRWWTIRRFMPFGLMTLASLAVCGLLAGFANK